MPSRKWAARMLYERRLLTSRFVSPNCLFLLRLFQFIYVVQSWFVIAFTQSMHAGPHTVPWILYFTFMSYTILTYYFTIVFIVSLHGDALYSFCDRLDHIDGRTWWQATQRYVLLWILNTVERYWNVASTSGIFVTVVVFAILYNMDSSQVPLTPVLILGHIVNSGVIILELVLNQLEYPWFNLLYCWYYLAYYALLAFVYHKLSFNNIYPFLDPTLGYSTILGFLLTGLFLYTLTFVLLKNSAMLRDYNWNKSVLMQ